MLARVKQENLALVAARHRVSEARAEVVSPLGVWTNPNVSLSSIMLTRRAVTGGKSGARGLSGIRFLPIGGQPGLRQEVAKGFLSAETAFEATVWQLVSDAKVAYLELQRSEARAKAIRLGLDDLSRVEAIVKERTSAGARSPTTSFACPLNGRSSRGDVRRPTWSSRLLRPDWPSRLREERGRENRLRR